MDNNKMYSHSFESLYKNERSLFFLHDVYPRTSRGKTIVAAHRPAEEKTELRSDYSPSQSPSSIEQHGKLGFNGVCVDVRMHENFERFLITIQDFNAFLPRDPLARISDQYIEFLKERVLKPDGELTLRDLVFSHADLHPRNLLLNDDGAITRIVDWENAGWYSRNWEGVKVLNNISFAKGDMEHENG
ncbi:hypothetical protein EX30DRAFT_351749 [Ascodesmis nigricans]|uniref:Aminoglycoside phosphotransferase domain-containing protein n=1 Tax=Ascodesmis nigricans TaxID=341454 RepID=A0A4S2MRB5_9PEZI|nr:hypothetical protein EX30DRAFT_351749 [Ascodesmis nigricans]